MCGCGSRTPSCMEGRVWRRGPPARTGYYTSLVKGCEAANPYRPNGIDLAGVTICRWWGWGACCTLRGQLHLYVVGAPHRPSCMQESQIWQQSLTRS